MRLTGDQTLAGLLSCVVAGADLSLGNLFAHNESELLWKEYAHDCWVASGVSLAGMCCMFLGMTAYMMAIRPALLSDLALERLTPMRSALAVVVVLMG